MNCVRCESKELVTLPLRGEPSYRCDGCKGILIPRATLENIFAGYQVEGMSKEIGHFDRNTLKEITGNTCPACLKGKLELHAVTDIELDSCPECEAIWFDIGELDRLGEKVATQHPDVPSLPWWLPSLINHNFRFF